jgi:hypothetical protein
VDDIELEDSGSFVSEDMMDEMSGSASKLHKSPTKKVIQDDEDLEEEDNYEDSFHDISLPDIHKPPAFRP